jgi:hypothetical protein
MNKINELEISNLKEFEECSKVNLDQTEKSNKFVEDKQV